MMGYLSSLSAGALLLAFAAGAFFNAASENRIDFPVGSGLVSSGLAASQASATVEREFRQHLATSAAIGEVERSPISSLLYERARVAYSADPLEISAARTIALGRLATDDRAKARRLLTVITKVQKRDTLTNLWMAHEYGQQGDMEQMLAFLDLTLRASPRARGAAIPIVVNALEDPRSFEPLGALLLKEPEWENEFWGEFVDNTTNLESVSEFFGATGLTTRRLDPADRTRMYVNLRKRGSFKDLAFFAEGSRGNLDNHSAFPLIKDGDPLGWILYSTGKYSTRSRAKNTKLEIDAEAGAAGRAAEKIVSLDEHSVVSVVLKEPVPSNVDLELRLACVSDHKGGIITLSIQPGSAQKSASFKNLECNYANLEILISVQPGRKGALVQITSIQVD